MALFPAVEAGDGWERTAETVETLFELPGLTVKGAIRRFEDRRTATALGERTGVDRAVRFVAATQLSFEPGLPPGTLPAAVLPSVRQEARRAFRDRLRERGVRSVERGRSERLRVGGSRVRLRGYEGRLPLGETALPVEGWVGAWHEDAFLVVTGGHPARQLAAALDTDVNGGPLTVDPGTYRTEFFDLLRGVRAGGRT